MPADSVLNSGAKILFEIVVCSMADCISGRRCTIPQGLTKKPTFPSTKSMSTKLGGCPLKAARWSFAINVRLCTQNQQCPDKKPVLYMQQNAVIVMYRTSEEIMCESFGHCAKNSFIDDAVRLLVQQMSLGPWPMMAGGAFLLTHICHVRAEHGIENVTSTSPAMSGVRLD